MPINRFATRTIAATAAAAIAISLAACSSPAEEVEVPDTLQIAVSALGIGGPISSWNPAEATTSYVNQLAIQGVYDVLINYNWSGEEIPSLATGYEMNEDRTVVTLQLRDDVDFVDGEHMTAEGVAKWMNYVLSEESKYVFKATANAFGIEFEATGEYELELRADRTLFHPDYYVSSPLRLLFQTPILSPAVVDNPDLAVSEPVGSGPYIVEDSDLDTEMTLVRNPDYWNPDRYPYDTVILRTIPDPVAQLNALKSGQVDGTSVGLDSVAEVESTGLGLVTESRGAWYIGIWDPFNSTVEALRDPRVRQAIAYSLDRDSIVEQLAFGYGHASSQVFAEGQPEYIEGEDDRYDFDLEKARELMAEAGYEDGFEVRVPINASAPPPVLPAVKQALADINITLIDENIPAPDHLGAILSGNYPMIVNEVVYRNTLRNIDEPFTGLGRHFVQNEEIDELLATIRFSPDEDESFEASQELGRRFLEEAYYISIYHVDTFYAFDPEVTDVVDPVPFLYNYHAPKS